jgi:hypothetical protein
MRLGIAASVGPRSEALLLAPGTEHLAGRARDDCCGRHASPPSSRLPSGPGCPPAPGRAGARIRAMTPSPTDEDYRRLLELRTGLTAPSQRRGTGRPRGGGRADHPKPRPRQPEHSSPAAHGERSTHARGAQRAAPRGAGAPRADDARALGRHRARCRRQSRSAGAPGRAPPRALQPHVLAVDRVVAAIARVVVAAEHQPRSSSRVSSSSCRRSCAISRSARHPAAAGCSPRAPCLEARGAGQASAVVADLRGRARDRAAPARPV